MNSTAEAARARKRGPTISEKQEAERQAELAARDAKKKKIAATPKPAKAASAKSAAAKADAQSKVEASLAAARVVPVVALEAAETAVPVAQALIAGGISIIEIVFRTEAAEEALKAVAAEVPEMLVGAGTVLTTAQAERALAAGAKFIVAPGLNPKVRRSGCRS